MIEGMKTNRKNVGLRLLLPLCLLPSGALAQQSPPAPATPAPATPAPTLAQALGAMPAASVGDGAVALTVGAEGVRPAPLPPPSETDAGLPENPIATPQSIAARYGRMGGWFGHVYALAPPTMTVLNTSPALADLPLSVLASQHPTPFLIGSFSPEQLRQMAGEGLAFGDLTPDQQGLLKAMLPHPFLVVPRADKEPVLEARDLQKPGADVNALFKAQAEAEKAYIAQGRTIAEDELYAALRLHGFMTDNFVFDSPAGSGICLNAAEADFETTGAFKAAGGGRVDPVEPGKNPIIAYMRADTVNAPKESDFNWSRRDLERGTGLGGVKTVDELVTRLARATGLELYADRRYGALPVVLAGDLKKPRPASDVMQALAVCVSGAWRQVGPAYVLTDDVQGMGARQEFLREMVQTWSNRLSKAGKEVGGHLRDMDWMHTLRFAPADPGALPSGQVDGLFAQHKTNVGSLAWKDLPDSLKVGLRRQLIGGAGDDSFAATSKAVATGLKPDTSVRVEFDLQLAVSLPDTGVMALGGPYLVQTPPEPPTPGSPDSLRAPENSISVDKPLRGILCALKTPDEARAAVTKMSKMGLNTLFLDVFTNGRTYFSNTALPPETDQAAGVLRAALDAARPLHVRVYAVLDALCWRKDGAAPHPKAWPAGFMEDLTVGGEAPDHSVQRQIEAHSIRYDEDREYLMVRGGNQGWASPLDPKVRPALLGLVRAVAATPGLAGLAFQDTAPPGYLGDKDSSEAREEGIALGHAPETRLAYLRQKRVDPVDLSTGYSRLQLFLSSEGFTADFDVSVPSFSTDWGGRKEWEKYKSEADTALMADCYTAARQAAPALPLFMRERQMGVTFEPWTDPKKLTQYPSLNTLDYPFHAITPQSILTFPYGPVERAHPDWFVWGTKAGGPAGGDASRAGGEVFDLVTGYSPDRLSDTLDRLNVFLKKPANP